MKRARMQGKPLYTLEDYARDPVDWRFYDEELQAVKVGEHDVYKIEKLSDKENKERSTKAVSSQMARMAS